MVEDGVDDYHVSTLISSNSVRVACRHDSA